MNHLCRIKAICAKAAFTLLAAGAAASAHADPIEARPTRLQAVMVLYGISEEAAIDRLAKEADSAEVYRKLLAEPPTGYAGAWFDGFHLRVGLSSNTDAQRVLAQGAVPVYVDFSLEELEQVRKALEASLRINGADSTLTSSYVDYRTNRVVISVPNSRLTDVIAAASELGLELRKFQFRGDDAGIEYTANVLGANRTKNYDWNLPELPDEPYICSVGVSVVGGFATAGHCGQSGNTFTSSSGVTMGQVASSLYDSQFSMETDSGWVDTVSGWTPTPYVNGYSDGTISVPAKWSGLLVSPIGTTVCYYGATSAAAVCSEVDAFNATVYSAYGSNVGVTVLDGACSQDGDSGGPFLSGTDQIQGTVIGKHQNCGTTNDTMYFQPVQDTLDAFSLTMLTAHGHNMPTVSGFSCPDMDNSGGGFYYCSFDYYNSQGSTSIQWSPSSGPGSTTSELFGTCTIGHAVSVTLATTNPAGTSYRYANFTCPDDPP